MRRSGTGPSPSCPPPVPSRQRPLQRPSRPWSIRSRARPSIKKQKDTGIWGGNLLALAPSVKDGIKEVGTIPQYRRLLQIGWPRGSRPFKLTDRILFRLLSRDEDPALLFEFGEGVRD